MDEELIARREALRSLDRRLTAVAVDIENIVDEAHKGYVYVGPVGVSFALETSGPEGSVLEELSEIAHELSVLVVDEVVPEVPTAAGWSATASDRIVELRRMAQEMQLLVREAFDETVAKLPPTVVSEPLAEIDVGDEQLVAPGDNRKRNYTILATVWTLCVGAIFVYNSVVDMDAVAAACAAPSPCAGDEPEVTLHPGGWIVVHHKSAACEDGVRELFDRKGQFIEQLQLGETPVHHWPKKPARNRARCADMDSLRWTWVMGWRGD